MNKEEIKAISSFKDNVIKKNKDKIDFNKREKALKNLKELKLCVARQFENSIMASKLLIENYENGYYHYLGYTYFKNFIEKNFNTSYSYVKKMMIVYRKYIKDRNFRVDDLKYSSIEKLYLIIPYLFLSDKNERILKLINDKSITIEKLRLMSKIDEDSYNNLDDVYRVANSVERKTITKNIAFINKKFYEFIIDKSSIKKIEKATRLKKENIAIIINYLKDYYDKLINIYRKK
jgi:hypothetical protein